MLWLVRDAKPWLVIVIGTREPCLSLHRLVSQQTVKGKTHAKQEGFAVNTLNGYEAVIRRRYCHARKSNGHRDLPAGAANKTQH